MAAYLQFERQLRTSDNIKHDIPQVIDNDNFVPEINPYLKRFANSILDVKERVERKKVCQKDYQEPEIERNTGFVAPLKKRGRPPQKKLPPGSEPRRQRNQTGRFPCARSRKLPTVRHRESTTDAILKLIASKFIVNIH
ncbi:hypothetical protein TNCV_3101751 [Trichonephila clavipes]|nr:hypothetical protein TNCV_3101751 [Trichonephila clavipes]